MTAPVRKTAANPSASGAAAAARVPKAASRMRRMSGNPISSPRVSWCFAASSKFDQIAGSPITFVCASTSWRRSFVASSIEFDVAPA